ncbi:MAG: hypothetical protein J0I06_23840 [Planctomycetes bacterium]|nr:hypothetical protein [Planctomycetota bacterium]
MRSFAIALLVVCAGFTSVGRADAPTPFVDSPAFEVGKTYTEPGSIIHLEGARYLVVVITDTHEYVVLRATAKKGVVPDDKLGRPVKIEAKLLARKGKEKSTEENLEILSVK